jgi:hypothetical protein
LSLAMSATTLTSDSMSTTSTPKPSPTISSSSTFEEATKKESTTSDQTKTETAPNGMKKIIIGVCAMQRKANSKPMKAIMQKNFGILSGLA